MQIAIVPHTTIKSLIDMLIANKPGKFSFIVELHFTCQKRLREMS
jgi:hypothetical protein